MEKENASTPDTPLHHDVQGNLKSSLMYMVL